MRVVEEFLSLDMLMGKKTDLTSFLLRHDLFFGVIVTVLQFIKNDFSNEA
jgi:hypothetical protein